MFSIPFGFSPRFHTIIYCFFVAFFSSFLFCVMSSEQLAFDIEEGRPQRRGGPQVWARRTTKFVRFMTTLLVIVVLIFVYVAFRNTTEDNDKPQPIHHKKESKKQLDEEEKQFWQKHTPYTNFFSSLYGYSGTIDKLRKNEFPQLEKQVYLDYMGAGQYQKSQITRVSDILLKDLYCNSRLFFF